MRVGLHRTQVPCCILYDFGIYDNRIYSEIVDNKQEYVKLLGRLRKARREAGLNQVEVAQKLGKPQPYVSKIESGEKMVDALELKKFSVIYKKSIEWFLK